MLYLCLRQKTRRRINLLPYFFSFEIMAQKEIQIHNSGISNIKINRNISEFEILKPLKDYVKKEKYFFQPDSSVVYFLSPIAIRTTIDFEEIDDLFVVTDSLGKIKMINIFFKCSNEFMARLLTRIFGVIRAGTELLIPGSPASKQHLWVSKSGINFLLRYNNDSNINSQATTNLMIYSINPGEYLGEWNIRRQK